MTIELQTLLSRSEDRMGEGMHPVVKETSLEVIRRAYIEGIYVQLSAGYRSIPEQNALYIKGRRGIKGEKVVTNAKGGQSIHNYGLAVDFFLLTDDGKSALWTVDDKWKRVAAIAKELGFEWGGDWTSFYDPPHLQMTGGLTLAQLQKGQKPNLAPSFVQAASSSEKEDDVMSQKFEPSIEVLRNGVRAVLIWFEQQDPALSQEWRLKFDRGELSISDGVAILFEAINRGYIPRN